MQATNNKNICLAKINEASTYLLTVGDWLRFMVSEFNNHDNDLYFGHGSNNAYDEACYLLLKTLHLPLDSAIELFLKATLLKTEIAKLVDVCKLRLIDRLPAAYITKHAMLQGYDFYIDERSIVPRSFIAELILSGALDELVGGHSELVHNVLDLCCGNASLAIIASDYFQGASHIVASDCSQDALEVARVNIARYGLTNKIRLVESDLWDNLHDYQDSQHGFDLIITNPPYVSEGRMASLPREYTFEPRLALAGGDNGLELIDKILTHAKHYLNDNGILVVEMGDDAKELILRYNNLPFNWLPSVNGDGFIFSLSKNDLLGLH